MRIYCYLRASGKDQNADRAKSEIIEFCKTKEIDVSAWFYETESGAKLKRPELFKSSIPGRSDIFFKPK